MRSMPAGDESFSPNEKYLLPKEFREVAAKIPPGTLHNKLEFDTLLLELFLCETAKERISQTRKIREWLEPLNEIERESLKYYVQYTVRLPYVRYRELNRMKEKGDLERLDITPELLKELRETFGFITKEQTPQSRAGMGGGTD